MKITIEFHTDTDAFDGTKWIPGVEKIFRDIISTVRLPLRSLRVPKKNKWALIRDSKGVVIGSMDMKVDE